MQQASVSRNIAPMGGGFDRTRDLGKGTQVSDELRKGSTMPGPAKRTLVEGLQPRPGPHPVQLLINGPGRDAPVQRKASHAGYGDIVEAARAGDDGGAIQRAATAGLADGGGALS